MGGLTPLAGNVWIPNPRGSVLNPKAWSMPKDFTVQFNPKPEIRPFLPMFLASQRHRSVSLPKPKPSRVGWDFPTKGFAKLPNPSDKRRPEPHSPVAGEVSDGGGERLVCFFFLIKGEELNRIREQLRLNSLFMVFLGVSPYNILVLPFYVI